MKLIEQFFGTLRPSPPPAAAQAWTPPLEPMAPQVSRLWALFGQMKLPSLSAAEVRQLAVLLDPELQGIVNDCVVLLGRRGSLGAPIGLEAAWLDGQLRLALELERLEAIAADLTRSAETAIAALLAGLGAFNARVLLHVQGRIADTARPEDERRRLRDQFRGVLAQEDARAEARTPRGATKKADALASRAEAARSSQAVLAALRSLRGALGQEGGPK